MRASTPALTVVTTASADTVSPPRSRTPATWPPRTITCWTGAPQRMRAPSATARAGRGAAGGGRGVGERLHPATRQRPAVAVAEQLQQESERAARRRARRQARVLRRSGQPCGGACVAVEDVQAERFDRADQPPKPLETVAPERQRQSRRRPHRRQAPEDR